MLLVVRALSVITAAREGIGAKAVEDILSCDDAVLNDVYQWWTPPVRRLPPLYVVYPLILRINRYRLWKRLRDDLGYYLVEVGACGVLVYRWYDTQLHIPCTNQQHTRYHRQFKEAAEQRYLFDEQSQRTAHRILADYFRYTTRIAC